MSRCSALKGSQLLLCHRECGCVQAAAEARSTGSRPAGDDLSAVLPLPSRSWVHTIGAVRGHHRNFSAGVLHHRLLSSSLAHADVFG